VAEEQADLVGGNWERRPTPRAWFVEPEARCVLFQVEHTYFRGDYPLAAYGYNRDGKKGKLQVNYGLLTDRRGCPVAVSVFKGNVGDTKTLMPQVRMLRERFGLADFVLVGDRGMITQKQVNELREEDVQCKPSANDVVVRAVGAVVSLGDGESVVEASLG